MITHNAVHLCSRWRPKQLIKPHHISSKFPMVNYISLVEYVTEHKHQLRFEQSHGRLK